MIIVEGKSDEESLEYVLSKIVNSSKIKFVICHGDITSDYKTNARNVAKKISHIVEEFLESSKGLYTIEDIKLIVHIVDTDACSIDACNIIESDTNDRRKLAILKIISKLTYLSFNVKNDYLCIPYTSYYMSCNLEHVLHNNSNIVTNKEKEYYSMVFSFKYLNKISDFVDFINSKNVGTELTFDKSWENILKSENALKRETNLNLFVNDYKNED